jgi:hypothetical protein
MTELGQRQTAFLPRLPWLRLATAALVLGAALAGAAIVHEHRVLHISRCAGGGVVIHRCPYISSQLERPSWVDPLALGICLLGLAIAAAILVRPLRRFVAAALILVAAAGGAVALSGHRVLGAQYSCPGTAGYPCFYHPRPVWVVPAMAGLVVLGTAAAAGGLAATRRRST